MAQWPTNPTRNHGAAGPIPGPAQWAKDCVAMSRGAVRRRGPDPTSLRLRRRPVATAPIREPPYAAGAALEKAKRQNK